MDEQQIAELIRKYNEGTLDPEQQLALDLWYLKFASESEASMDPRAETLLLNKMRSDLPLSRKTKSFKMWPRIGIAAAVVAAMVSATLWYFHPTPSIDKFYANDKLPGKNGATLTLANGKKINISVTDTGEIAHESGVRISRSADGKITYEVEGADGLSNGMNTLETSNGQQAQVHLPDGTWVQLNAASSLKYPFAFKSDGKRMVELSGEGYFQVSKDPAHPFIVTSGNQQVEVLGTEFNISAYRTGEPVKTTLLEGSIKISEGLSGLSKMLVPGQQASVREGDIAVDNVEVEYAVAWRNGYFLFKDETLQQIMQKLSRWYNIEPVFADPALKNRTFFGSISKFENISKILFVMEQTDVASFEIKGNQVIISKK